MRFLCLSCWCLLSLSAAVAESPWPDFRGPNANGVVMNSNVPASFGDARNITWKSALPGKAWSSPVVADGKVWATTAIEVFPTEEERLQMLADAGIEQKKFKQLAIAKSIKLQLLVLDWKTGKLESTIELTEIDSPDPIHSLNSYASPTPVIEGDHIFCHFGTYGTFCLDRAGRDVVWHRQLPLVHSVGPGSSPFIDGPRLVLIQDGVERQYVTALDKATGSTLWEVERPEMDAPSGDMKKAYCTPIKITDPKGREQLICMGSQWMVAYEPETGNEIWKVRHGKGFSVVPRPVYGEGIVYFATGFGDKRLWAVKVDGSGDVTDTHVAWMLAKSMPTKPSPILHQGLLYVIDDTGIATCVDAMTGDEVWKKRISGKYSASPLLVGENIYVGSHEGTVTVFKAAGEFEKVAENQLSGQIMASPAVVGDSLLIRTSEALYRISSSD
ncbi:MAG: PQQ-binding-like beta-propeller repeat protein [Planctomycetota bacterium]